MTPFFLRRANFGSLLTQRAQDAHHAISFGTFASEASPGFVVWRLGLDPTPTNSSTQHTPPPPPSAAFRVSSRAHANSSSREGGQQG